MVGRHMTTFRALWLILITMLACVTGPSRSEAASAAEIDAYVNATLTSFESQIVGARELASKAAGILVFPSVVKAGIGLGGEYGEGLLIIRGRPAGYYNLISGSFGFQLGVQARRLIIMFMSEQALASFQNTYGWKAGVDGSIAVVTLGTGGAIDTENLTSPVLGFILDPAGLMYNLTPEGSHALSEGLVHAPRAPDCLREPKRQSAEAMLLEPLLRSHFDFVHDVVDRRVVRHEANLELRRILQQLLHVPASGFADRNRHRDVADADAHVFLRVGIEVEHDRLAGIGEDRAAKPPGMLFCTTPFSISPVATPLNCQCGSPSDIGSGYRYAAVQQLS